MDKLLIVIIVFSGYFVTLVSAQNINNNTFLCYTCNPSLNPGSCANPLNGAPVQNCTALVSNITLYRYSCFSTFLVYNNSGAQNLTGIHRGCHVSSNAIPSSYCALSPGVNVTHRGCSSCSSSYCNTHLFNSAGQITGGGSGGGGGGSGNRPNGASSILAPTIFVLVLGVTFSYIKNEILIN